MDSRLALFTAIRRSSLVAFFVAVVFAGYPMSAIAQCSFMAWALVFAHQFIVHGSREDGLSIQVRREMNLLGALIGVSSFVAFYFYQAGGDPIALQMFKALAIGMTTSCLAIYYKWERLKQHEHGPA